MADVEDDAWEIIDSDEMGERTAPTRHDILLASIAISLKRIADWLDGNGPPQLAEQLSQAICRGIYDGLKR